MKGVVKYDRGDGFVDLREVEEIAPRSDQVKIQVEESLEANGTGRSPVRKTHFASASVDRLGKGL